MINEINKIKMKRMKYTVWLDEWLILQKEQMKESTYSTYYFHIEKHIKPYFKNIFLSNITHEDIQEFINYKLKKGRLDGKGGLSSKSVREMVNVIKLSLKYAVNNHYIKPINLEFKFPNQVRHIQLLNKKEYQTLTDYLKDSNDYISKGLLLILCTGIRIGELCALKNSDFNLDKKELYINKTLQRIPDITNKSTKIIISTTKTHQSMRVIPIPNSLIPYLDIENNDHYFLTQSSKYIEPRIFRYKFKNILKKLQISEVTVHSLRHYFASECIELGFDYNCLSEILGHSSPSTTMNLYVHSMYSYKKECMNKIII